MDNVSVQRELTTMLRQASGVNPITSGWTTAIDEMFNRGATPSEILARAKVGLQNSYHRNKLLDGGARYINWKWNDLIGGSMPAREAKTADSMKFDGWHHERWEVALHQYDPNRAMTRIERDQWLADYMSKNRAVAHDMVECPICTTRK